MITRLKNLKFKRFSNHRADDLDFHIDRADGEAVVGWIWRPGDAANRVGVELLVDGEAVAEVTACLFRQDLLEAEKGDGRCGFGINIPRAAKDGKLHKLSLRVKGQLVPFAEMGDVVLNLFSPALVRAAGMSQPSLAAWTRPHCTVVAMGRNEGHRADTSMRHFCALFDRIIIIDHLSDDRTAAIAAGYRTPGGPDIHILRSDEPGYLQSQYMTAVTNAVLQSGQSDWLFFLDFDEFMPFASKADFHQTLVQHANRPVISGPWLNCATDFSAPGSAGEAALTVSELASRYLKVAVNLKRLHGKKVVIEQGNHAVSVNDEPPTSGTPAFGVLHLPVLSKEQLATKIALGTQAYEAMTDRSAQAGFHWFEIKGRLSELEADPNFLRQMQLRYGEPLGEVVTGEPQSSRPIRLAFAMVEHREPARDYSAAAVTHQTLQQTLADEFHPAPTRLPAGSPPAIYRTLQGPMRQTTLEERRHIVKQALLSGPRELELIVPSAWVGHEPFLFTLMEAMRPRRYAELGTHHGQSFFAACQHYKAEGNYGEAVAIDLWEGDHQAGFYSEGVFESFRDLQEMCFPACGRYIRAYFSDAVEAFEDASIDLLHIDGLHTYDAVRSDYETWRRKVTDCGVILFHDTTEYHSDFGVWQFFHEIRSQAAASFNFHHSHGLGVLAFGTEDTNPAIALLNELASDPTLYERHFASLGRIMNRSARFRFHEPK